MKSLLRFSLPLLLLTLVSLRAADDLPPHIAVVGTASVQARPDLQRWRITVTNKDGDIATVSAAHTQRTAAVLRFLKEQNILPADVQTAAMSLSENREYQQNSWVKLGYIATTQIAFTLKNPASYQAIWNGLSQSPEVAVEGVTWDISDRSPLQERARTDALTSAKLKAQQMVSALGSRLGEPLAVEEILLDDPVRPLALNRAQAMVADSGAGGDESISPGEIGIRSRVSVTFRLLTP